MAHDHVEWYTMTYKEIYRLVLWHHDGNSELNEGSKMKVDDNQHGACAVCRARTKEEGGFKDLSMHINLIPMLSDSFRSRFNWSNIFQKGKQIRVSFNISSPAIRGSQGESASQRAQVLRDYFNELEEESIKDPVTHPFHAHSMPIPGPFLALVSSQLQWEDNFVITYELLDEMMDNGYPQTTEAWNWTAVLAFTTFLRQRYSSVSRSARAENF